MAPSARAHPRVSLACSGGGWIPWSMSSCARLQRTPLPSVLPVPSPEPHSAARSRGRVGGAPAGPLVRRARPPEGERAAAKRLSGGVLHQRRPMHCSGATREYINDYEIVPMADALRPFQLRVRYSATEGIVGDCYVHATTVVAGCVCHAICSRDKEHGCLSLILSASPRYNKMLKGIRVIANTVLLDKAGSPSSVVNGGTWSLAGLPRRLQVEHQEVPLGGQMCGRRLRRGTVLCGHHQGLASSTSPASSQSPRL